jgi:hypothetical protein
VKEFVILVLAVLAGLFFMHDREKTQELAALQDQVNQLIIQGNAKDSLIANNNAQIQRLNMRLAQASASSYQNQFHSQFQPRAATGQPAAVSPLGTDSLRTDNINTHGVQGSNDNTGSPLNQGAYRN